METAIVEYTHLEKEFVWPVIIFMYLFFHNAHARLNCIYILIIFVCVKRTLWIGQQRKQSWKHLNISNDEYWIAIKYHLWKITVPNCPPYQKSIKWIANSKQRNTDPKNRYFLRYDQLPKISVNIEVGSVALNECAPISWPVTPNVCGWQLRV